MTIKPQSTEETTEREFDHFSIVPFKAVCGADRVGQSTTQDPRRAKCAICWQYWKEWDSSYYFSTRISPASTAPVVDANEVVRQIRDKLVNGNPAALIEDIAKLVELKQEGESKCEHGVPWSMECLSCGHSDYVAAAATTASVEQSDQIEALRDTNILCRSGEGRPKVEIWFKDLKAAQGIHKWLVSLAANANEGAR